MPYYFLNHLRPITARPTKPDPTSVSVMGSETGGALSLFDVSIREPGFVAKLDMEVLDVGSSVDGQPTKPKKIITIHKNINNFFILPDYQKKKAALNLI